MSQMLIPFPGSWFANKSWVRPKYEISISSLCFPSDLLGVSEIVSLLVQLLSVQKQL